jgi:hypothetical protein
MTRPIRDRLNEAVENPETVSSGDIRTNARDALAEMDRLEGLLQAHGIHPDSEFICRCGLRREKPKSGEILF